MSSPFAIKFMAKNPTPKKVEKKEKPLTEEEKKRLHAVSSVNYDKIVSSGGVDLGIIKNKNKNKS